jgi:hypothetical protein
MNRAPINPVITPSIIAAGKSSIEFSPDSPTLPNFKEPESDRLRGAPVLIDLSRESVNVAKEVAVKTLQSMLKVQNVLGLEIS